MASSVRLSSPDDYANLIDKYDTWMFDCDGVLWHGDRLIDGAVEVLALLRRKRSSSKLLTQNSLAHTVLFIIREEGPICDKQRHQVKKELQIKIRRARCRGSCGE